MIQLPQDLLPFQSEAEELLSQSPLGEIEFSGRTYQVQFFDPKTQEEVWAFLQFDRRGQLKDRFCSCEGAEDVSACQHIAAGFLRIFSGKDEPLHRRFRASLWNALCRWYCDLFGDDTKVIQEKASGVFFCRSEDILGEFQVRALNDEGKQRLQEIFFERPKETEETSLKFSTVPEEEIRRWKAGRPTFELRYRLSFWSDLAKWLMLLQDRPEPYRIEFFDAANKIPQAITISFPEVEVLFELTEESLNFVIPALSTVESPLIVHSQLEEQIQSIKYHPDEGVLEIVPKEVSEAEEGMLEEKGISLKDWIYIPSDGFYPKESHPFLCKRVLTGDSLNSAFNEHLSLIGAYIKEIHHDPIEVSYALHFDRQWNLHIVASLFAPRDLCEGNSRLFGDWAYLDGKGFYPVEGVVFDGPKTVIPCEKVGEFVRQHRVWLNSFEGFESHITGVETKLTYSVTDQMQLVFSRKALIDENSQEAKDFGSWIYIRGEGFYSKVKPQLAFPFQSGLTVRKEQVALFIRMYEDELPLVTGFFSNRCPIQKAGVKVLLLPNNAVAITPIYEFLPEYQDKEVRFFEEYTYVPREGFHRIPAQHLLPEKFRSTLTLEKDQFPQFFAEEMGKLQQSILEISPQLVPPSSLEFIGQSLSFQKEGYVISGLRYQSEHAFAPFSALWSAIQENEHFIFSEAGLIDLTQDRFKWIKSLVEHQVDVENDQVTLSALELLRLNAFDSVTLKEGREFLQELLHFKTSTEPNLVGLSSTLRPYQELGVKWLWFLFQHNLSGLLCDDMGLGKTHQAMALMAAVKNQLVEKRHFLVVCPTSVIYHWEEKLKQFLPGIKVCTFHGVNRSLTDFEKEYDILLTSYGIWRNECELLSPVSFEIAVFDEIQAAKNQTSRIHQTLKKVKARIRVGLTGTPIENRLQELKALFDLILPGYMPSEEEYRKFFVMPIEKENHRERKKILSQYIKPFVLRRRKEEVLLDLPEKTEEISHCELSLDQRLLYTDVLHKVRGTLLREIEDRTAPIPYIHIFSALSSLKQICNHPAAYLKSPEDYKDYQSGKWNLFIELFSEARESGQKVVIFSQYLAMLDIIESFLNENQIGFAAIRGATLKRGEEIRRFNEDPSCEVFVGSLQAAGLGIDLTAASVVIHYDRWWNAAREDQATDRVHRIGQTRGVQVFKLVTKGTFEERIDEMILQKGQLMEEVVGVDDHRILKGFNRDEIVRLFKDLA